MGQGQTKPSKKREANGEPSPSPKKEAKKSSKRSSKSSRSSGTPSTETPSSGGKEQLEIEERQDSPRLRHGRESEEKEEPVKPAIKYDTVDGSETLVNDVMEEVVSKQIIESPPPPKPKRTYDVSFEQEKENVPANVSEIKSSPKTPVKMNGEPEPLTPVHMNDLNHISPQATSTPHPNGMLSTGRGSGGQYSDDDQDHTDVSDDEAFSSEQQFPLRTSSPSASNVSLKSFSTINSSVRTHSDSAFERKTEVNYGKFYNTSYLKPGSQNYLNQRAKSDSEAKKTPTSQFIRPANFSYSKDPPSFLKGKKGGMATLTQGTKVVTKTRRSSSPAGIRKNSEAVRMSMFPGGKPPAPKEVAKIEREDWPGPPSPAALLPEIMRQRRKSRGEEEEEEEIIEDPKIKREIEELSKFKDESGIGKVIYKELEEAKALPMKLLDPWKASRVPNADHEPKFQTRFQSPMFASPSRFIDRPRRAWDDSDIRGYRTMSTLANYPVPKPGYGLQPKAATLPVSGAYGGPLDYRYYDMLLSERHDAKASTRTSNSSINTDTSKVTSTVFDQPGVSLMTFQKSSWHTDVSPSIYPYDRLKISNFDLPKDVDRNMLEIHLSKDEFESIFDMAKEEFRHLPEWKQNDLKRRMDLY